MYDDDGNELENYVINQIGATLTDLDCLAISDHGDGSIRYNIKIHRNPLKDRKLEIIAYAHSFKPEKSGIIYISSKGDVEIRLFVTQNMVDLIKTSNRSASFALEVCYNKKKGSSGSITTDITEFSISPHIDTIEKELKKTDYSAFYKVGIFLIILLFLTNLYVLYQYIPQKPL